VLLLGHAAGDEDSEVTDGFVDRVDDRLSMLADVVHVVIEIEDPAERLLRRRDVVALGAEHDDRRTDVAEIDRCPVRGLDGACRELVADEQLVDDRLDLLGVQVDVAAPPLLEAEIARRLGVDLGIQIVLLAPQRVGGILALEILHQPGAVELAVPEVAGERREPAAAQETAAVAHGILAVHAGPVGQRRPGDDDRAEQLGTNGRQHHHRPAGLAIADHARIAVRLGVERDDLLEEDRLGAGDILERLAGHRLGQEADEIAGMPGLERHADLAVGLEAADAGAMPGTRVDDDEGPAGRIDLDALRRNDADERVIDRSLEGTAVDDELGRIFEDVGRNLGHLFLVLVATLAHDVPEQDAALRRIDHVFDRRGERTKNGHGDALGGLISIVGHGLTCLNGRLESCLAHRPGTSDGVAVVGGLLAAHC
jgi:hypothetical protein